MIDAFFAALPTQRRKYADWSVKLLTDILAKAVGVPVRLARGEEASRVVSLPDGRFKVTSSISRKFLADFYFDDEGDAAIHYLKGEIEVDLDAAMNEAASQMTAMYLLNGGLNA